jgi:transposase-like protein
VSTWSGDGHFRADGSHPEIHRGLGLIEAAAAQHCGEAEDCRRDVGRRHVGGAGSASAGGNANQVFYWRKLYEAGRLSGRGAAQLLPARVQRETSPATITLSAPRSFAPSPSGTIHVEMRQAQVRLEGNADPALVRVLLEWLRHDRVAVQHADLDCVRSDRLAARLHGTKRVGADEAGAESVVGARTCVSRTAGRPDQSSLV